MICPKFVVLVKVRDVGLEKFGVFVMLNISERNSALIRSVRLKRLKKEMSIRWKGGPVT